MKMRIHLPVIIVMLFFFSAWMNNQQQAIEHADWLIGTWENKTDKGSIYESWKKLNSEELAGRSYIVKEKDTIVFENIMIRQTNEGLFYIPVVINQNQGLPVRFAATKISATQLVFENEQHDFPQRIAYTKINEDSLAAQISGTKNGKVRHQTFRMKRLKF